MHLANCTRFRKRFFNYSLFKIFCETEEDAIGCQEKLRVNVLGLSAKGNKVRNLNYICKRVLVSAVIGLTYWFVN